MKEPSNGSQGQQGSAEDEGAGKWRQKLMVNTKFELRIHAGMLTQWGQLCMVNTGALFLANYKKKTGIVSTKALRISLHTLPVLLIIHGSVEPSHHTP